MRKDKGAKSRRNPKSRLKDQGAGAGEHRRYCLIIARKIFDSRFIPQGTPQGTEEHMTRTQVTDLFDQWKQEFVAEFSTQILGPAAIPPNPGLAHPFQPALAKMPPFPLVPQGVTVQQQIEYAQLLQHEQQRQQQRPSPLNLSPPRLRAGSGVSNRRRVPPGFETAPEKAEEISQQAGFSHPYLSMMQPHSPTPKVLRNPSPVPFFASNEDEDENGYVFSFLCCCVCTIKLLYSICS